MIPYTPYTRRSLQPAPLRATRPDTSTPDLQTQFEALLDAVWKAEGDWRFNDRLDIALKTRRSRR
jgi:hypothetical protein